MATPLCYEHWSDAEDYSIMAGIKAVLCPGEVALTGTTAKTVLQLVAATNQRVVVKAFSAMFDGISPTNEAVVIILMRQTTAGTMTSLSAIPLDSSIDETIQTTGRHTATVEPTPGAEIMKFNVHPQTGLIFTFPPGQEIVVPGGTRLGIYCVAPNSVNVTPSFTFEE